MPIPRGMHPSGVGVGRSDAPRALQGQLCTAGPILLICSWQEARFRTWAEAGRGQALDPQALWHLHLLLFLSAHPSQPFPPRSLPKESPAPRPTEGGPCSACRRVYPIGLRASRETASTGLVLWASVLFLPRGQLCYSGWAAPRRLRCGPLRAHFPSQAQGRSPVEEGELPAGLHRDTVCTRCGAQTLLGEFCLLSPGARPSVHLSICQLQSLGVLSWVPPCH